VVTYYRFFANICQLLATLHGIFNTPPLVYLVDMEAHTMHSSALFNRLHINGKTSSERVSVDLFKPDRARGN